MVMEYLICIHSHNENVDSCLIHSRTFRFGSAVCLGPLSCYSAQCGWVCGWVITMSVVPSPTNTLQLRSSSGKSPGCFNHFQPGKNSSAFHTLSCSEPTPASNQLITNRIKTQLSVLGSSCSSNPQLGSLLLCPPFLPLTDLKHPLNPRISDLGLPPGAYLKEHQSSKQQECLRLWSHLISGFGL